MWQDPTLKPPIYCRYVDDILLVADNFEQVRKLKNAFKDKSVLKFTYEIERKKLLPFLDTLITRTDNNVTTTIYTKATSTGECINFNSLCPDRYKIAVIKNFLHRAFAICSTWELFHIEVTRIKQLLVNNNFPNQLREKQTMKFLQSKKSQTENTSTPPVTSVTTESEENNDGNNAMNSEATERRGRGVEGRGRRNDSNEQ